MSDLFISAGEPSGDLYGAELLEALPGIKAAGVGGPKMRAQGLECILPMEELQVMGFVDVFCALPKLLRHFYHVRRTILKTNPKVVVLIDYPGFHLRLARHLREKGFQGKICHYICPSVWAWGKKRIPQMAKNLDLLLSILPFEAACFASTTLPVKYIGHPLAHKITPSQQKREGIALFPGSRKKEILRNFPLYVRVAKKLLQTDPHLTFSVSVANPAFLPLLHTLSEGMPFQYVEKEKTYALMARSTLAIAKSGTVTLELALHDTPTVVTYGVSKLDHFIAHDLLRIILPHYCLVNIIAGKELFPELISYNFTEENLFNAAHKMLRHPVHCSEKIRALLGSAHASREAARLIHALL